MSDKGCAIIFKMLIEHIHGSQVVRFAQGGVSVNVGWSGRLRSRLAGQDVEKQKTRNPLTEVNRPCPPVNQGRGKDWDGGGHLGGIKLFILGNNIVSNIKPRALTQIAEKGKVILLIKSLQKELSKYSYLQNNRVPVEGLTKNIIW